MGKQASHDQQPLIMSEICPNEWNSVKYSPVMVKTQCTIALHWCFCAMKMGLYEVSVCWLRAFHLKLCEVFMCKYVAKCVSPAWYLWGLHAGVMQSFDKGYGHIKTNSLYAATFETRSFSPRQISQGHQPHLCQTSPHYLSQMRDSVKHPCRSSLNLSKACTFGCVFYLMHYHSLQFSGSSGSMLF